MTAQHGTKQVCGEPKAPFGGVMEGNEDILTRNKRSKTKQIPQGSNNDACATDEGSG
jgi:hypothetical protein